MKSGGHPENQALAKATDTPPEEEAMSPTLMVRDGAPKGQDAPHKSSRPVAFASQAAPCAGRTRWAVMYSCGACGGTHFGRSRVELTTGKRLARCGRVVWLIISRTYRGRDTGAQA
jgi:hypothetical protein